MSVTVREVRQWMRGVSGDTTLYIDDDGLTLRISGKGYIEVGGNDEVFRMTYECLDCNEAWTQAWHCVVNDKCKCGREIQPIRVDDISEEDE